MKFSIYINQPKALEWGLNLQQAALFAFLYEVPSWAEAAVINGEAYYWLAKEKVCEELPVLTTKPDTVKHHMAHLEAAGLIERKLHKNKSHFRVTELGKSWNHTEDSGENNPTSAEKGGKKIPSKVGKKSQQGGKKIPASGEKNPTNYITKLNTPDNNTNDYISLNVPFDEFWDAYDKKIGSKPKLIKKWEKLSDTDREKIMQHVPVYVAATPDKQFRKHPETYLNNQAWNDEVITSSASNSPHLFGVSGNQDAIAAFAGMAPTQPESGPGFNHSAEGEVYDHEC